MIHLPHTKSATRKSGLIPLIQQRQYGPLKFLTKSSWKWGRRRQLESPIFGGGTTPMSSHSALSFEKLRE